MSPPKDLLSGLLSPRAKRRGHRPSLQGPGEPSLHKFYTLCLRELMKTPFGSLGADSSCYGYVYHAGFD